MKPVPHAPAPPVKQSRRTQAQRREESALRLLEAGLRVVARHGTERMTLAEVGKEAGYSRGLAGHHFGSKSQLLQELTREIGRLFTSELRRAPERRAGLEVVRAMVASYLESVREMPFNARASLVLMVDSSTMGDPVFAGAVAEHNRVAVGYLSSHLEIARTMGQIPVHVDCANAAVVIMAILRGALLQRLVEPDSVDMERLTRFTLQAVDRLLCVEATPQSDHNAASSRHR